MRSVKQPAVAAAPSPLSTRELAEALAVRLALELGRQRLELEYEDGHLVRVHRHERFPATALGRFDRNG